MPNDVITNEPIDDNSATPLGLVALADEAIEFSANDIQEWRAQDIAIAEHARILSDMQKMPWFVESIGRTLISTGTYLSADMPPLIFHARLLSMLSNPIATTGEYRNNSRPGSTYYVNIGNTRVECADRVRCNDLLMKVNTETFKVLAPFRRERIRHIRELALGQSTWALPTDNTTYINLQVVAYASAQICVLTESVDEAKALVDKLNAIMLAAIGNDITASTRAMILALGGK